MTQIKQNLNLIKSIEVNDFLEISNTNNNEEEPKNKLVDNHILTKNESQSISKLGLGSPLEFNKNETYSFSEWLSLTKKTPINRSDSTNTSKEFSKNVVQSFKTDSRDFHIITDLGGGFGNELNQTIGDNWIILDHHQISDKEKENENIINSWKYGIDGGSEICAGGMAYFAAMALNEKNSDLSEIAVVSALGDRQDQGENKSFTGKNFEIANTAKELGLVEIDLDLLLVGRETRPLAEALAFTSQPFIEGLTWNKEACFSLLKSSGIELKEEGRWRVPSELNDDEKKIVIETIANFSSEKNTSELKSELIGYTYTFPREDKRIYKHIINLILPKYSVNSY